MARPIIKIPAYFSTPTRRLAAGVAVSAMALMVFAFNNCGGFSGAQASLKNLAASCLGQKAEKAALEAYDVRGVCEDIGNYRCDLREFRPGIGSASEITRFCLEARIGSVCFDATVTRYETSGQKSLPDLAPGAFDEGGEFNHSEASCYNTAVNAGGQSLIQAGAATLALALDDAISKCQERRR